MTKFLCVFLLVTLPALGAEVQEYVLAPRQGILWSVSPSLTLEPGSGKVLAVWQKHPQTHQGRTIWGRLISSAGEPSGAPFPIVMNDNTFFPQVVYNPIMKEFLLVYSRDRGDLHLEIYAQRLNLRGRKKGEIVRLSPASDLNLSVQNDRAVFNVDPNDGSYFVTWQRSGLNNVAAAGEGVIAARFDRNLNPIGSSVLLRPLVRAASLIGGPYVDDVAFHRNGKVIISMETRNANGAIVTTTYSTMTVDPQNITAIPAKIVKSTPSKFPGGSVVLIGPGDRSFIFISDTNALKRRALNAQGEPAGPISNAVAAPARLKRLGSPNAFLLDDASAMLAAIEYPQDLTQPRNVWIQTLSFNGKPLGPAESVKTLPIVVDLTALPLPIKDGNRVVLLVFSDGQTFGEPSGLILLKVKL